MPDQSRAVDPADAPDPIPTLLTRIERQLARIADALEALNPEATNLTKDLGPTRTMPKPPGR